MLAVLYFAARDGSAGQAAKENHGDDGEGKAAGKTQGTAEAVEPPKIVETPKIVEAPKEMTAPPPTVAPPVVAPPAAELPSFDFDGGKLVQSSSDPVQLYKGLLEYALRSKWNRPTDMADDDYVVEVEVSVDRTGQISDPQWKKSSGNKIWDDSVRQALAATKSMTRPPPTNFPPRVDHPVRRANGGD